MKDILSPNVRVQYLVRVSTELGNFTDALYFTGDQWDKLEQADIDKTASDRAAAWVENVKHPPAAIEPTKAELEAYKEELVAKVSELTAQIAAKG